MADSFFDKIYRDKTQHTPDVLSCLANLSNDEVFTPPDVVNKMLDLLPQELFCDPNTTFLDPACKTGVFLREIAKRLLVGIEDKIPDLQQRIDHIFHKQLFGIAITELTSLLSRRSLYCSKYPNGPYSITHFDDAEGNIRYRRITHTWVNGKCKYCGASKEQWQRDKELETHAYWLIHSSNPEEIFNMKFDVIISNPPYHLTDSGNGTSAKPIYNLFVEQSKKLAPRFLIMIIPSRWFAGGKGLESFRHSMLSDKHIRKLVDFENYKDVFPGLGGLAGGACYFVWDRDNPGLCEVVNKTSNDENILMRSLDEFDVFIRSNKALSIIHKVQNTHNGNYLSDIVSSRKPFGLPTNYPPQDNGMPCQFIQRIGLKYARKADVTDQFNLLNKWKIIVPKAPIAGQTDFSKPVTIYYESNTKILPPGTCCTESFIVLFAAETKEEVLSFKSYIYTKIARFLLLMSIVSQDITRDRFRFVPNFNKYDMEFSDKYLCDLWGLTPSEYEYINSRIGDSGGDN